MADTGKQSPLGLNTIGSYLKNQGLTINPVAASYMGTSKRNEVYTFGKIPRETSLRMITWAIHDAYNRGEVLLTPAGTSVYDNLISIGKDSIPALGNSRPLTYVPVDPSNVWARKTEQTTSPISISEQYGIQNGLSNVLPGPATSGYGNYSGGYGDDLQGIGKTDQKQNATWYPYDMTNPNHSITQWGWIRCHALQAWNEFNWNGTVVDPADPTLPAYLLGYDSPEYKEFLSSFLSAKAFSDYMNQAIMSNQNSKTFLDGAYSNMDDLISGDIYGISLANKLFGTDLENLGQALNLSRLDSFGLPSVLLQTLGQNNAVIQDLVLALLSSGLESSEVQSLVSGTIANPTIDQEKKIYSAFLIMIGENLQQILAPLKCVTPGLTSLADLLDVKKLFPNSYQSLTVPKYNSELGLPTNSKTYYPIYLSGGVNEALTTDAMNDYVGVQTPKRKPKITRNRNLNTNNINTLKKGFGSYLYDILPKQQAVAAGALSFTMRQVRNIDRLDIKKFAKATKSLENTRTLALVNGTSKPTNQAMINNNQLIQALGSGPYGTYTMSDFFGCMSGLPYPWERIYNSIKNLETPELYDIDDNLFLAVTWEEADVAVVTETREVEISPGVFQTEYRVASFTIVEDGGGYGRESAPAPIITASNGGSGYGVYGTDNTDIGSLGGGTFGRIISVVLTDPGAWQTTVPTATIENPPGPGWPAMNTVVQNYIDQANTEIANIFSSNPGAGNVLNTYWDILGSQLTIEQRARYIGLSPVPVAKDYFSNPYPNAVDVFTDSIPNIAQDTAPHMAAQTLEAISDLNTIGGQSTVAMMRQERNQVRMIQAGIPLDNNIPADMSDMDKKTLTTNGTLAAGINNVIKSPTLNTVLAFPEKYGNTNGVIGFTNPSWPQNQLDEVIITPSPNGVYVPSDTTFIGQYLPTTAVGPGDITPILNGVPVPVVNPLIPVSVDSPTGLEIPIVAPPNQIDTNIPPNLDTDYIGSTMLPATYSIQEAIDKVVECNCDCWLD